MHPVLPPRISCLRVRRGKTHRRDRSEGGGGNCVPRKACGLVDLTRIFVQNSSWLSANVGSIHLPKNYKISRFQVITAYKLVVRKINEGLVLIFSTTYVRSTL